MILVERFKLYRKWWSTWGTLPVSHWVKAAALYRQNKFNEAQSCYLAGLQRHPRHAASTCARLDLAFCYFKCGEYLAAENLLKEVINCSPQTREAYVRLAQVQMWLGFSLEAAWTMRRALRRLTPDAELVALFMRAVLDNEGPSYLLNEAMRESSQLRQRGEDSLKLQVARARLMMMKGDYNEGRSLLSQVVARKVTSLDAIICFAEVLTKEDKIAEARHNLDRALAVATDHPRVLSLLAETYLKSGDFYNSEFAVQLATSACQKTSWASPRDMHVLAESYYHQGDKIAALLMASKAKDAGSRLMGSYRDSRNLDKLIENLSSGTLA